MTHTAYDLIVIGSGPAGEKAAVKAAYFGKRVALVEQAAVFGGAGVNTGTLPSKTLKETALFFSGKYDRGLYGVERTLTKQTSAADFLYRQAQVSAAVQAEVRANLVRHGVDLYQGTASFADPHNVIIRSMGGKPDAGITGRYVIIATGSYPFHPPGIPFDGRRVHDSDSILRIGSFPKSLCIVGAGVIGCEYATIFATMGTKVTLINDKDQILGFLDREISNSLVECMRREGVDIRFNASVKSVSCPASDSQHLTITLGDNSDLSVDMFLFAAGRSGNTAALDCAKAGVTIGKREAVLVNERYQTNVPHIYAVGDVIGFPALASTSMDQGRVAVSHIFETGDLDTLPKFFPYGIYTVPEVSMVGMTEQEAEQAGTGFCTGRARHVDTARGRIMGASEGYLKVIFDRKTLVITGVHIIGHLASELIHFGLALVSDRKTVMDVISTVFNYPTLHDLYKYACYDGLGNLSGHKVTRP